MDFVLHVLEHSIFDTLELVPLLFLTYLAMEAIEHTASAHVRAAVERSGKAGPVVGSLLGALPQCGFSAMAATLYAGRVVTVGTLVAVVLSTSDEMVPVFLAHQEPLGSLFTGLATASCISMSSASASTATATSMTPAPATTPTRGAPPPITPTTTPTLMAAGPSCARRSSTPFR